MTNAFGLFVREMRKEQRVSLRAFALQIEMDPSNLSKIERGRLAPPEGAMLERIGDELGIQRSTPEWQRFLDLATTARGQLPADVVEDPAIASALPAFFQRLREEKITDPETMYEAFRYVIRDG